MSITFEFLEPSSLILLIVVRSSFSCAKMDSVTKRNNPKAISFLMLIVFLKSKMNSRRDGNPELRREWKVKTFGEILIFIMHSYNA